MFHLSLLLALPLALNIAHSDLIVSIEGLLWYIYLNTVPMQQHNCQTCPHSDLHVRYTLLYSTTCVPSPSDISPLSYVHTTVLHNMCPIPFRHVPTLICMYTLLYSTTCVPSPSDMSEWDGTNVVEYSSVYMQSRVGTCLNGMGQMLWSTVVCILHAYQSGDMSEGDGT